MTDILVGIATNVVFGCKHSQFEDTKLEERISSGLGDVYCYVPSDSGGHATCLLIANTNWKLCNCFGTAVLFIEKAFNVKAIGARAHA